LESEIAGQSKSTANGLEHLLSQKKKKKKKATNYPFITTQNLTIRAGCLANFH
jgi:hypothetical protein